MNVLWGLIVSMAGLLLLTAATVRSEFVLYRLLVARSKMLWGENVYRFHQIAGLAMFAFGLIVGLTYL